MSHTLRIKQKLSNNLGELVYIGAQYSTPLVGLIVNFLMMRYISPAVVGKYQSVILYSSYLTFLPLGVFNGLNRNLAYYMGKGETETLKLAISSGFFFTLAVSLLSFLIVAVIGFSNVNDFTGISNASFVMLAVIAFIQPLITFFDTLYRTGQDFKALGKITLIGNIAYGGASPLMVVGGFTGLIFVTIFKWVFNLLLLVLHKFREIKLAFSFDIVKDQIVTGFPIMINAYLYTTFFVFDQFYISQNFSTKELGYYNLARVALTIFLIIPASMGAVLYPKAAVLYGKSQDQKSILVPFFYKALLINVVVVGSMVLVCSVLLKPFVMMFLPQYINGIGYAKISILGGLGYIYAGPSIILGVLKKNKINFIALITISVLSYGLYFLHLLHFASIQSLIWYKNAIFITYSLVMLLYIYKLISKK